MGEKMLQLIRALQLQGFRVVLLHKIVNGQVQIVLQRRKSFKQVELAKTTVQVARARMGLHEDLEFIVFINPNSGKTSIGWVLEAGKDGWEQIKQAPYDDNHPWT